MIFWTSQNLKKMDGQFSDAEDDTSEKLIVR